MGTKQEVSLWNERISIAKKWRDQTSDDEGWDRFVDEYTGKFDIVIGNIYVPPINEVYSYVQTALSYFSARNPYIAVNAKNKGSILGAYILEAAMNYYWRELKIKDEVEAEIMDALLVGHAWNKTGTNVKLSGAGDQLRVDRDDLFANRVSWRDVVFNVGSKRPPKDCFWMAHRILRPTDELKKEYGAAASKLNGAIHPLIDDRTRKNILYRDDVMMSAIWEIWDARERKICLIADESIDKYLEDPRPWPDHLEEFPFQMLAFNQVPDRAYPMSDVKPWEPQMLEKIKLFTMMLNHMKRWNRTMLSKKGTMTDADKDKFEKGIDGTVIDVNGEPQTMTKMVDFGSLPPDIYLVMDRLDSIIRTTRGMTENMQGGVTKTQTRTVGELEMIQQGAKSRSDRKQGQIETHIETIARSLMANMKSHFVVPTMVKITGNEPEEIIKAFGNRYNPVSQTIMFDSNDITGEYDVSIKAGSTLPLDKMTRDAILDKVLQTSIPLASAPSLPPFITEIILERLRDYDIKSLEESFKAQSQVTTMQQSSKMMEEDAKTSKTKAETAKREAQARQIDVETAIQTAGVIGKAVGVIPPEMSVMK